jgi:hypothetical protein
MTGSPAISPAAAQAARGSLAELYERGEHYPLLNAVLAHLESNPNDAEACFWTFRSYTALGLIGPALEMLTPPAPLAACAEFADIHEQLRKLPSGKLSWTTLTERFESNAARLYRCHPQLKQYHHDFRDAISGLELYRSLDGNLHLSEPPREGSRRRWLPDLADTRLLAAEAQLGHDPRDCFCNPYLILGDRLGAILHRVRTATEKMFLAFAPRIYLVEPDLRFFAATLHAAESGEEFCDERVAFLIGPDCVAQLRVLLERDPERAIPEHLIRSSSTDASLVRTVVENLHLVAQTRERKAGAAITAIHGHYDALAPGHWRRRFDGVSGQRLRVLGLTSRFTTVLQYSMRDLKAAFERLGHEFRLLMEKNDHDLLPPARTAEVIEEYKPDLIFVIDHLRREYEEVIPRDVPYVCWIQDQLPHLVNAAAGRSLGPLDFYVSPELDPLIRKYAYPAGQGMMWTMATDDGQYNDEPLPEEELAAYRCDFSFVSSQSQAPRSFHQQRQEMLGKGAGVRRLTDHLFEMLAEEVRNHPETVCGTAARFIDRAKRETGVVPASPQAEDALARVYVQPVGELLFRQATLEWAADYCDRSGRTLHLYGNGWEAHPRFGQYARGVAQNGRQLRAIYQASRINLQITSYGAIHQRLLDGLASGGFFMIRYCPTDAIGGPLRGLMDAVDRHGIQPDVAYQREAVPQLADALAKLAELFGEQAPGTRLQLPNWKLEHYRGFAAGGFRRVAGEVFDRWREVSFATAGQFATLAEQYLGDGEARKAIAASMRQAVVSRFTYAALVRDLLAFIRDRLNCRDVTGATTAAGDQQ